MASTARLTQTIGPRASFTTLSGPSCAGSSPRDPDPHSVTPAQMAKLSVIYPSPAVRYAVKLIKR
jgi:hypothetical protein